MNTSPRRQPRNKKGWVIAGAVCALTLAGAAATPSIISVLDYRSLVGEQRTSYALLDSAQESVDTAQQSFTQQAEKALAAYNRLGKFVSTVKTDLLYNRAPLDKLIAAREDIYEAAGLHVNTGTSKDLVIFPAGGPPRIPAATTPSTVAGLTNAIDRNKGVYEEYATAAQNINKLSSDLASAIASADKLVERVLASAADYAVSDDVLALKKADELIKARFALAVERLGDDSRDPVTRFTSFQEALAELDKSHQQTIAEEKAEEERRKANEETLAKLEQERKLAEERATREAEEIAAHEAQIKELEEARKRAEEALEKAREAADQIPAPAPTPVPTPAPTR